MSSPASSVNEVTIDPEHPWLGLFSYSEETRAYFHGRDEETAELCRRVQRKLLTVLFGQSGLGKTSLLRAGIVPRLRAEGYCPIYVRIVYAPNSPTPAEQIKQAIMKSAASAGVWTRPGSAIEGESLWEFLHHRGDLLKGSDGRVLMPLLIFDQFEEVFTLAQADDAGKLRAREFLEQLADLVENRPPAALETRIEQDDNAAEDFDFARADYRVLIALREDYLAHLEGVKSIMPSITQNRMRLARMTGAQALSAVVKPGGKLVSQEVAESIVRFVAGGSELGNAEIEPSLLSLVCRELNTVRQSQGRAEISADLLAGSRDTILSEFYERTLADQPAGVRRVIEDELLTESGYRESLAEERVIKALAAEGASADSLATLVNRRLLRIEERLDMRRVELTHDVLCSVVSSSRDRRHEREARDEAERQLEAQRAREAAQHKALVRARTIASVCAVLMVVAAAGAVFGWVNMQRARAADAAAQKSRNDAEKLVSFLIEDFYTELEPTGRLDTLGKLARKTVQYYDGLPPELTTTRTQTYRAMAMIREGSAQMARGDIDAAFKSWGEAQAVFEKLRAAGDKSEATTYGLALALHSQGATIITSGNRGTAAQLQQAADLLRPLVYGPHPSREVQQTYASDLNFLSHTQQDKAAAVATCEEARKVLAGLGALDLSNLDAASEYADNADSQARHNLSLGRIDQAQKLEEEVYAMTEKVLAQRPNDLHSLLNRYFATGMLSTLAVRRHDDVAAADYAERSVRAAEDYVRFNPADLDAWGTWIRSLDQLAGLQFEQGEIAKGIASLRSTVALGQDKRLPSSLGPQLGNEWFRLAVFEGMTGDFAATAQAAKSVNRSTAEFMAQLSPNDPRRQIFANSGQPLQNRLKYLQHDPLSAFYGSSAEIQRLLKIQVPADDRNSTRNMNNSLRAELTNAAIVALQLGRYPQAEAWARQRLALPPDPNSGADPLNEESRSRGLLAHALAMQGRGAEVPAVLQPALDYYQREQKAGAHGTFFRYNYAYTLYADSLAQTASAEGRAKREASLAEAAKLVEGASQEARQLIPMRDLAGWIASARTPRG